MSLKHPTTTTVYKAENAKRSKQSIKESMLKLAYSWFIRNCTEEDIDEADINSIDDEHKEPVEMLFNGIEGINAWANKGLLPKDSTALYGVLSDEMSSWIHPLICCHSQI